MAWTPNIYEDRPILRDRVLAAAAIGTVLIGGAMAMDTIVTGGWQWGVATASPHQLYYDDVDQYWSEPAPGLAVAQPVALAEATDASATVAVAALPPNTPLTDNLEGASATASPASFQPQSLPAPQRDQADSAWDDAESKTRFDAIEADMQQAMPQSGSSTGVAAKS